MKFIVIIIIAIIVILRVPASLMILIIMIRGRSFQVQWLVWKHKETHHCYTNTHQEKRKLEGVRTAGGESSSSRGNRFMRSIWTAERHWWNGRHLRGSESNQWHIDLRINCKLRSQVTKSTWVLASWWRASENTCVFPWESSWKEYGVRWAVGEFLST